MSYNYSSSPVQTLSSIYTFTANIIAFNATTNIATLDSPVDISLGYSDPKIGGFGSVTSQYNIIGTNLNLNQAIKSGNTSTLATDEAGNFIGIFNVPSTTFQTGSRVFRVDNRSVSTDPTTATTYAEATFTASGLSTTIQSSEFSPSVDSSSYGFKSVSQSGGQPITTIKTYSANDPIAQTFILDKSNYPNGLFLQSVKLFFATKPTSGSFPVTVSIIPTLNGYPSGQVLDHSTVSLTSDQILTSKSPHYLDSTTYTEFMFQAPVYVQSGVLYAIIINSNSPDYTLYYAQQNQIAIPSTSKTLPSDPNPTNTTKVGTAPYVGALFESQNSITWTADQTKDLMFVIDRCLFDVTKTPQIQFNVLQGLPFRKMGQHDISYKLNANNVSNLNGNFVNKNVFSHAYNLTATAFSPTNTNIGYQYTSTLAADNSTVGPYPVSPGQFGSPTPDNISLDDGKGPRILLANSNNSFVMTATLSSADANVSPIISDDGVSLFNLRYMINNMGMNSRVISLTNPGASYNANTITVSITPPDIGSDSAVLAANVVNGNVTSVYVTYQGSGYLTNPTITIGGANTTQATVQVYGETSQHGGNSLAKYFTKKVIMTPGNDSGDMRVYYTAYKPFGSNIYVYYKILSSQDTQKFDDGSWQLMTQVSNQNVYSSSPSDFIEFECAPGIFSSGIANNNISYLSTNGQTYNNFIQFAIKVVMASSDKTSIPVISDIRALALPPGTGI